MKVTPILAEHLDEVGCFLHEHLNRRFSVERWVFSMDRPWAAEPPNHGMMLRDGDRLVGVLCAIYSDQIIDGRPERFCNPHSWYVIDSYRRHAISLVLSMVKQRGYHFTMFTPNAKVTEVFRGLKFKDLDDRQHVCINLPVLARRYRDATVRSDPQHISDWLSGQDRIDFEAHRAIPWLHFVGFGRGEDKCWIIYKTIRWKRLPCAWVMHVSHPDAFGRQEHLLRRHLLFRGMAVMCIEARWLVAAPPFAIGDRRGQPKLFLSPTLADSQVRDVYSELMSLDV